MIIYRQLKLRSIDFFENFVPIFLFFLRSEIEGILEIMGERKEDPKTEA